MPALLAALREAALPFATADWARLSPVLTGIHTRTIELLPAGVMFSEYEPEDPLLEGAMEQPSSVPLFYPGSSAPSSPAEPPPASQVSTVGRDQSPSALEPPAPSATAPPASPRYELRAQPRASSRAVAAGSPALPVAPLPLRQSDFRPSVEISVPPGAIRRRVSSAQLSAAATSQPPAAPPLITSRSADSAVSAGGATGSRLPRGSAVRLFVSLSFSSWLTGFFLL